MNQSVNQRINYSFFVLLNLKKIKEKNHDDDDSDGDDKSRK